MAPDKHAVRAVTFLGRSVHTVLNEQGAVPSALVALGAHRSRRRDPALGLPTSLVHRGSALAGPKKPVPHYTGGAPGAVKHCARDCSCVEHRH
jgi:hypothetical protein